MNGDEALSELRALVKQWWADWHREFDTTEFDEGAVVDLTQLIVHNLQLKGGLSPENPVPEPEGWDDWGY